MHWIHHFQLFLFDFDGLLVNTEHIHYQAYKRMCAQHGFVLDWSFSLYCQAAHHHAEGLRDRIYEKFPALYKKEPDWKVLYAEKKQAFKEILNEGVVELMPGVDTLLRQLDLAGIKRCVVTHSPLDLITIIRQQNSLLNTIPYWITREKYTLPKPHPECYLKAIKMYAEETDKIIGFEDSARGLNALMQTKAKPVLICPENYPDLDKIIKPTVNYFSCFDNVNF